MKRIHDDSFGPNHVPGLKMNCKNKFCAGFHPCQLTSHSKMIPPFQFNFAFSHRHLLGRAPAILISDDFIRSNEIFGTNWPIY